MEAFGSFIMAFLLCAALAVFLVYLFRDNEIIHSWLHSNKIDAATKEARRKRAIEDRKVKLARSIEDSQAELKAIEEKEETETAGE